MSNSESKRESINGDSTRNRHRESNEGAAGPAEKPSSGSSENPTAESPNSTETSASGACGRDEPCAKATEEASPEEPPSEGQSSKRQSQRVSVTPRDWGELEALSEEFGLPYSRIYNMSFNALLEKLGRKEQR
jgi:hypothetical protein